MRLIPASTSPSPSGSAPSMSAYPTASPQPRRYLPCRRDAVTGCAPLGSLGNLQKDLSKEEGDPPSASRNVRATPLGPTAGIARLPGWKGRPFSLLFRRCSQRACHAPKRIGLTPGLGGRRGPILEMEGREQPSARRTTRPSPGRLVEPPWTSLPTWAPKGAEGVRPVTWDRPLPLALDRGGSAWQGSRRRNPVPKPVSRNRGEGPDGQLEGEEAEEEVAREVVESRGLRPTQSWRHPGLSRPAGPHPASG